jgi:hypothetical protein
MLYRDVALSFFGGGFTASCFSIRLDNGEEKGEKKKRG